MHWRNKMPTSQLLVCYYVNLKMEGHLTFLLTQVLGQQLALDDFIRLWQLTINTWELLELKY
jgi:hypothetical protein